MILHSFLHKIILHTLCDIAFHLLENVIKYTICLLRNLLYKNWQKAILFQTCTQIYPKKCSLLHNHYIKIGKRLYFFRHVFGYDEDFM